MVSGFPFNDEKEWLDYKKLLDNMHNSMRDAIANMKPNEFEKISTGAKISNRSIITGIAFHDVYHAG